MLLSVFNRRYFKEEELRPVDCIKLAKMVLQNRKQPIIFTLGAR